MKSISFLLLNIYFQLSNCSESNLWIGFIILSQTNVYHDRLAEFLKEDILNQASELNSKVHVNVFLSHRDFEDDVGHWAVYPLFPKISKLGNFDWIIVLEDQTKVDLEKVLQILSSYKSSDKIFAGYPLRDSNPTIIHHFADISNDSVLLYPHFSAGFFISKPLFTKLTGKCEDCSFSIDPKYELAKYIWNTAGIKLKSEPGLCLHKESDDCATWIEERFPNCGFAVENEKIIVAVKTCKKFHKDRDLVIHSGENFISVVKNTWGPEVRNLRIFSDSLDKSIPTIKLDVENMASGHCEKTFAILEYYTHGAVEFDWLVVVDDDTILSFHRLRKLLSCYNAYEEVAFGERYGYGISNNGGYNYLTGGSGMIFTKSTVAKLVDHCRCPSPDSPDDMIIGLCLKSLDIPVTHSPFFHQARPVDYSEDFLAPFDHISFHKHWMIDPYSVYRDWLQGETQKTQHHEEL